MLYLPRLASDELLLCAGDEDHPARAFDRNENELADLLVKRVVTAPPPPLPLSTPFLHSPRPSRQPAMRAVFAYFVAVFALLSSVAVATRESVGPGHELERYTPSDLYRIRYSDPILTGSEGAQGVGDSRIPQLRRFGQSRQQWPRTGP